MGIAFQTWCICHKFSISLTNYFITDPRYRRVSRVDRFGSCENIVPRFQTVNFMILSLFFRMSEICYLLMPNSWAKFVPFSPLSKREIIICLSLIDRTARFRFVDMLLIWVYDRWLVCLHNPRERNWSSMKFNWQQNNWVNQISAERIRIFLGLVTLSNFEKRTG